jgi:hypothetical protein
MNTLVRVVSRWLSRLITIFIVAAAHDSAWAAGPNTTAGNSVAAFLVSESEAGDLNGDGDAADDVLFVYDATTDELVTTGLAAAMHGRPGILGRSDMRPSPAVSTGPGQCVGTRHANWGTRSRSPRPS